MKKNLNDICIVCKKDRRVHEYLESLDDELWNVHVAAYTNLELLKNADAKRIQSDL